MSNKPSREGNMRSDHSKRTQQEISKKVSQSLKNPSSTQEMKWYQKKRKIVINKRAKKQIIQITRWPAEQYRGF
jgi:hypothetical protein